MIVNLSIIIIYPLFKFGIVHSYELLFRDVPDLNESLSSSDPFSHPIFKDMIEKIGSDTEIIHKSLYPRKYMIYICLLVLVPLSFTVINIYFVINLPAMYIGVFVAVVLYFWIGLVPTTIGYSSFAILTQNHLIEITLGIMSFRIECISFNYITHVKISPGFFKETMSILFYSKELPLTYYTVSSEKETNAIFKHLDIVQDDDALKYHTHSITQDTRFIIGIISVPIIIILLLFYIGIGIAFYPLSVKITLFIAPTIWMSFLMILFGILSSNNDSKNFIRKLNLVEEEN